MKDPYSAVARSLLAGDDETAGEILTVLAETTMARVTETDDMSYLYKFEEFLDEVGAYTFKGWLDAVVVDKPAVGKFWVTVELDLPGGSDLGAHMLISGRDRDAVVTCKKVETGYRVRVKVLRNVLDRVERRNKAEADKEADAVTKEQPAT